ncbi:MAG: sortase [Clostridia bacterium]|nr:sortase [Clostridia bacterium]
MATRKLHTAGVGGHFVMLFTPFLIYSIAICLIAVFVFQVTIGNSTAWRLLTAHKGAATETEVNHEFHLFTPQTISSDDDTKVYYNRNEIPPVRWGDCWGSLTIPALGTKDRPIYCGSSMDMLEYGVCSNYGLLPGEGGNTILTFHVNREKASGLYNLQDLEIGERIEVTASYGTYVYFVTERLIFESDDTSILNRRGSDMLTIYTCYPKEGPYRSKRFAVVALLDEELSSPTWRWPDA